MKVIFLSFLVVCAAQVVLSSDNLLIPRPNQSPLKANKLNITEILQQLVKDAIDKIIKAVESIQTGIDELLREIIDALLHIQEEAIAAIAEIFDKIQQQLEHLQHAGQCVKAEQDAIKNVSATARASIKQCVQVASEQLNELHNSLTSQRDSILDELKSIQTILVDCANPNPFETIRCVRENIEAISNSAQEIVALIREALSIAVPQIANIRQNARQCIHNAHQVANDQNEVIVQRIKDCIKNNHFEEQLLLIN